MNTKNLAGHEHSIEELALESGKLAAVVYGGRAITYYRDEGMIREIAIVVNGFISEHYSFLNVEPYNSRMEHVLSFVGNAAWGFGLRALLGFDILSSSSIEEYHRSRSVK